MRNSLPISALLAPGLGGPIFLGGSGRYTTPPLNTFSLLGFFYVFWLFIFFNSFVFFVGFCSRKFTQDYARGGF